MLILAIETATEHVGVGIIGSSGVVAAFDATRGRYHAEIVVPAIEFVCRHGGVSVDELSGIAVDLGPGLFTGMRVGLSTAKAMSLALEVPLIGVSSLEVLAHGCRHSDRIIVSVIDARKGQVFFGFHRAVDGAIHTLSEARVGRIDDVVVAIEDRAQPVVCVGDGAVRYRSGLEGHQLIDVADPHLASPSVRSLAILGWRRALKEEWSNLDEVSAIYVRPPDAEINWSTRPTTTATEQAST